MRPRDSQRLKVYRAELTVPLPDHLRGWLRSDQEALLREIECSRWARNLQPGLQAFPFVIAGTRRHAIRCWHPDCLEYPNPWDSQWKIGVGAASTPLHVVHAAMHYVQPRDSALHGAEFARLYLQAVRKLLDPEVCNALSEAFRRHRVKSRVVSQEARDRARHRALGQDLNRRIKGESSPLQPNSNKRAQELVSLHANLTNNPTTPKDSP